MPQGIREVPPSERRCTVKADMIIKNAKIYTSDADQPRACALVVKDGKFAYYQDALDLIRSMAEAKGATMAQIALAWMMNRKPYIVPIPGTRTPARMKENADASDIVLTAEELDRLEQALDRLNLVDTTARRIS